MSGETPLRLSNWNVLLIYPAERKERKLLVKDVEEKERKRTVITKINRNVALQKTRKRSTESENQSFFFLLRSITTFDPDRCRRLKKIQQEVLFWMNPPTIPGELCVK